VNIFNADFEVTYVVIPGNAQLDVTLQTLIRRPCERRSNGRNVWVTCMEPKKLTSNTCLKSSTGVHSIGANDGITPALLTTPQRPEINEKELVFKNIIKNFTKLNLKKKDNATSKGGVMRIILQFFQLNRYMHTKNKNIFFLIFIF